MFLELLKFGRICGVPDSKNQNDPVNDLVKYFGRFFQNFFSASVTVRAWSVNTGQTTRPLTFAAPAFDLETELRGSSSALPGGNVQNPLSQTQ